MVQMIARDVAAANVGLEIKVFPGSSLVKAQEQWKAMLSGQIDMTSFPLDYASGFHPQFGATLMPGLVKSHAHARRDQRLALHEGHQGHHRTRRRQGAGRRLAGRRLRRQGQVHQEAGGRGRR